MARKVSKYSLHTPPSGNPFKGDGPAPRKAMNYGEKKRNAAVTVTAHYRARPQRRTTGNELPYQVTEKSFAGAEKLSASPRSSIGLDGEPAVNHLKAAIGLISNKRA